jgi:guanylate kinase
MPENPFTPIPHEPLLIVISGLSGAGKDSVLKELRRRGQPMHFVVTATNRPPRSDEVDGRDYIFISDEAFATMIEQDELLEYALVYNQYKGVPKSQVRQALASGNDVVMRIDVQGAATIRRKCPEAVLIFLTTESEEALIKRLRGRSTETDDSLHLRVAAARQELERIDEFDYVVVNFDSHLAQTVDVVVAIIESEHHRAHPRKVTL